jgi:histidine triad (HIT) family protein
MPADGELSATLFIEITHAASIRPALDRLIGVDEHVALVLLEGADERVVPARFDPNQLEEDRISAVQYIKFAFGEDELRLFCDPSQPARLRIDHPQYQRAVEITPAVRASLIEGLRTGPVSLLPESNAAPVPDSERVVFETGSVRGTRPAHPHAPGHLVIEPIERVESLLDAEPELLAELMTAVQRVAAEVVRQHGACRVHVDLGGHSDRLRWHVYAPPS